MFWLFQLGPVPGPTPGRWREDVVKRLGLEILLAGVVCVVVGCGDQVNSNFTDAGSGSADAAGPADSGGSSAPQDAGRPDAGLVDASVPDGGNPDSGAAALTIRIRATTAPFPHADGYAGQTARATHGGCRSISLLKSETDPTPLVLFNHGADPVEVGYDDGNDTVVATVPTQDLVDGHYVLGRLVQTHSRYQVDATSHLLGTSTDGYFDDLLVMSDGTRVDGQLRDSGYYHFVFHHGVDQEVYTGDTWHVPEWSSTAGAWAVMESGEWAVYFSLDLDVDRVAWAGKEMTVLVNMDHAMRWIDNPLGLGYRDGVWDVELPLYETVMQFGGNRFDVTVQ